MSNPYLPEWEYVPDGEPHVFGDRLYIFGSHDKFNAKKFCEEDYVGYSAPLSDLSDWRCDGVIYKKTQHPGNEKGKIQLYAPDVVKGNDGRFYLYYCLADVFEMGVAVCDTPTGKYEFLGLVKYSDGTIWGKRKNDILPFDPAVINDDGHIYLYAGQGPIGKGHALILRKTRKTAFVVELEDDMLTMKNNPKELVPCIRNSKGTSFRGHEFFEGSSIRKFNNRYYFIYSSLLSHELVYAVSDKPDTGFEFGGILTSNTDLGYNGNTKKMYWYANNHGSVEYINGNYYVFGHRHTNRSMYSRQGYADLIEIDSNGNFKQAPRTSSGFDKPTQTGFKANSVSHLMGKNGVKFSFKYIPFSWLYPYITQENSNECYQYIKNFRNKSLAGFRYADLSLASAITLTLRGHAKGKFNIIDLDTNTVIGSLNASLTSKWNDYEVSIDCKKKKVWLGITFIGSGVLDILEFKIK